MYQAPRDLLEGISRAQIVILTAVCTQGDQGVDWGQFKRFRKRSTDNRFERRFLLRSVSSLGDFGVSSCRRGTLFFPYSFRLWLALWPAQFHVEVGLDGVDPPKMEKKVVPRLKILDTLKSSKFITGAWDTLVSFKVDMIVQVSPQKLSILKRIMSLVITFNVEEPGDYCL